MDDWTAKQLRRKKEDESIMVLLDKRRPDFAAALAKAFSQHREDTHVREEHQVKSQSLGRTSKRSLPQVQSNSQSKRHFQQKSSSSQSYYRQPSQSHGHGIQAQSSSQLQSQGEVKSRAYTQWNTKMDTALANVLYDQINIGNKADGDRKPQAYQEAMDHLNATLGLNLSRDNVKNRLKSWKKHYAIISDITQQSGGFTWDDEKKMIVVTAENRDIWNNYVKSNPEAKWYQNKVIENWDDIVMLCGKDRGTGLGARNIEDVDEDALKGENEVEFLNEDTNNSRPQHTQAQTSTSTHSPRQTHSKKKSRKDPLAEALMRMATSVEEYIASKKKKELASEVEIYELVSKVEGLAGTQVLQAVHRLMHGSNREFVLLKALPNDKKKEWIEILLAHPST